LKPTWSGTDPGHADGAAAVATAPSDLRSYRYCPVFVAVSIARPESWFLPVTSVRM
ncbi:MAG: hypothetical protein QOI78_497, partial [Actinomycetota bacterium]|nr:hypothetical protein [Actinomycetota bacterium]